MLRALPLFFASLLMTSPAHAQGSLGFQTVTGALSYGLTEDDVQTLSGLAQLDVRITDVHGLQLDFGLKDTGTVVLGQLGAHLYMQPQPGQRYGLFVSLADADEYSVQYVNAGLEGRFEIAPTTSFEARFGVGGTTGMGGSLGAQWDYVFLGTGVQHQFSDALSVDARLTIAEFDELGFNAIGIDGHLQLTHSRSNSGFEIYAEIHSSALLGQDAAPSRTTIGTGITYTFGANSPAPAQRPFQMVAPLDQLIDRGIVLLQ